MTRASWAFLVNSVPFTRAVRDGETSLGGSESACLGLARALQARGHDVHIFATRLSEDAVGPDAAGVSWHDLDDFPAMNQFMTWDVVTALRMPAFFGAAPIHARLRLLWNQDLLIGTEGGKQVMAIAWAIDELVYVSDYHRRQWEDLQPELAGHGWVTGNGFDPAHVPASVTKDPHRIIHISRPERGLAPLLAMWPALRAKVPHATLQVCRYASMYDGEGSNVRAACESFDAQLAEVQVRTGGIHYLGSLTKPQLYKAIAEAAVMWYPGVAGFAETNCIAATEAQACGTPFVGSLKGALPETAAPSFDAGLLIPGDALTPEYQTASVEAVVGLLQGCASQSFAYRKLQQAGRAHVAGVAYDALAAAWEAHVEQTFRTRATTGDGPIRILRQLLQEDDHVAAKAWAQTIPYSEEASRALVFCDKVIQGKDQTADDYAERAMDPIAELEHCGRWAAVSPLFAGCRRVLDIACGNGAGAIAFTLAHPELQVVGLDYAPGNIEVATAAAATAGVGDRCTFLQRTVWDFGTDGPVAGALDDLPAGPPFDGLFCGEFVEHVANCTALVDWLETAVAPGALVGYTCPIGPMMELLERGVPIRRGHVHCFTHTDISAVWGGKLDFHANCFPVGQTPRGNQAGHWIIDYRVEPGRPAGHRDLQTRALRTRPMERLSVGIIARNAAPDIGRCLKSVWSIADEILVGDTGSQDETADVAVSYGAKVLLLPPIEDTREGFAGARNAVLDACTGEWFLWIDSDEQLMQPHLLRRYLDGAIFNGYVIHQHHLQLDVPPSFDVPVRLFRRRPEVQFYGCIHEQPQTRDCNGDIEPCLETFDLAIAHLGYLLEPIRRTKMLHRNLPLLIRDQQVFPDRVLGKVLVLRDYVNLSDYECETHGGQMTPRARGGYQDAIRMYLQYFDNPTHKYHVLARPWYERAMQRLGLGLELEWAMAGRVGGLNGSRAKPERLWVRDAAEFRREITFRLEEAERRMIGPPPIKTDPFVLPQVTPP